MAGGAGWRWPWSRRQERPGAEPSPAAEPALDEPRAAAVSPEAAAIPGADRSSFTSPLLAEHYQPQRPLQLQLQFAYVADPALPPAHHDLSLRWFWSDAAAEELVLAGHCQRSGSFGLFHSRWIRDCVEVASGEPVEALAPLLLQRFAASRHGRLEQLQQRHGDQLTVLLYLACADGLLQQREKQLVAAYLAAQAADLDLVVEELAQQLRWLPLPAEAEFQAAVQRLRRLEPEQALALIDLCEQVIDVKVSRDGQEQPGIDHLRAVLLG